MKSSSFVKLTLLGVLAATLTGCEDKAEVQRCVDQNDTVIDEQQCQMADSLKAQYQGHAPNPIPYWWYYHWIFGGRGGYSRGSRVYGGNMRPSIGFISIRGSIVQSNGGVVPHSYGGSVSRGGFGSIGSGHGGGVGE